MGDDVTCSVVAFDNDAPPLPPVVPGSKIEIELFVVAPVVIDVVGIVVIRVSVNCCGPVAIVAVVVVEG